MPCFARGENGALSPAFQHHQGGEAQIEIADGIGVFQPRQRGCVFQRRQRDIGHGNRGMDHGGSARSRPKPKAQIGIIGNPHTSSAGDFHGAEGSIAGAGRNRLADARQMQVFCAANGRFRHIFRPVKRSRAATAIKTEMMAARIMRHEVNPCRRSRIADDMRGIHPF